MGTFIFLTDILEIKDNRKIFFFCTINSTWQSKTKLGSKTKHKTDYNEMESCTVSAGKENNSKWGKSHVVETSKSWFTDTAEREVTRHRELQKITRNGQNRVRM